MLKYSVPLCAQRQAELQAEHGTIAVQSLGQRTGQEHRLKRTQSKCANACEKAARLRECKADCRVCRLIRVINNCAQRCAGAFCVQALEQNNQQRAIDHGTVAVLAEGIIVEKGVSKKLTRDVLFFSVDCGRFATAL